MKYIVFSFFLALTNFSHTQIDTIKVERERSGNSYLSEVLINKDINLGVFDIHYVKEPVRNSYLYIFNFNTKEVVAKFHFTNWTYFHSSWIDQGGILHLTKGTLFSKTILINLKTGEELKGKEYKDEKKEEQDNKGNLWFDSSELYCTDDVVYLNGLSVHYNSDIPGFVVRKLKL